MADTLMINVPTDFDLNLLTSKLGGLYQSQGYTVNTISVSPTSTRIVLDKNCGGINMLLGMGEGVTANCTINENCLFVNYTDAEWTGKIIGIALGWLLCFIPFITALIGGYNQLELPKKINNNIMMILSSMKASSKSIDLPD